MRWYAIAYLVGFMTVYLILWWRIKHDDSRKTAQIFNFKFSSLSQEQWLNIVLDFLLLSFFLALIGGRFGYVLFYNLPYFLAHPLQIISPYALTSGQYVGIFGMSYHGALLAIVAGSYVFVKQKKIDFFAWADFVVPAVALGYFFGRMGNFLNGELYGRVTNFPLGMYFAGDTLQLRHPSQLYEAALEGLLLFVILWNLRNLKLRKGTLLAIYLIGYGCFRVIVEYFREPDSQIGFLFGFMTMGQMLSGLMILVGTVLVFLKKGK